MKRSVQQPIEHGNSQKLAPSAFSRKLLAWYDRHRRVMPWRAVRGESPDPYCVWLSEIMLQQTTVATVGPYFQKFVARWPTIQALAKAKLEDVLSLWAGLGYYRRARALHEAARIVVRDHHGLFPDTEEKLSTLPGCGPYTAAAITSIAFGRPANVVDGNVERVMARLYAVTTPLPKAKPALRSLALKLVPDARPGDYAQALMDLGATVCTPRKPICAACPLAAACEAHAKGMEERLPRRARKKPKPLRRAMAFYVTNGNGSVLLRRRPAKGLLPGMMEVPSSTWREGPLPAMREARKEAPVKARWRLLPGTIRHVFSHFDLEMVVAVATSSQTAGYRWAKLSALDREALPSVMHKVIRHARIMEHKG
jgi:A/G-specific adenine glycosylase